MVQTSYEIVKAHGGELKVATLPADKAGIKVEKEVSLLLIYNYCKHNVIIIKLIFIYEFLTLKN